MNIEFRWILPAILMAIIFNQAIAQTVPEGVKKPGGAQIEPVEKVMCKFKKRLYEVGAVVEINSKDYICTKNNSWVLSPKSLQKP